MKKTGLLKLSALVMMLAGAATAAQAASLEVNDFEMTQGTVETASLNVIPDAGGMFEYRGFQFDLTLRQGITLDFARTSAMNDFKFYGEEQADGTLRVVAYLEGDGQSVSTATDLMTLAFSANYNATPGENEIEIGKVIFSSPRGRDIYLDDSDFTITIIKPTIEPTSLSVVPNILNMEVGDTDELVAIILPEDTEAKGVTWTSSDETIATVNSVGVVTGVAEGMCFITATSTYNPDLTDFCTVTVRPKFIPVQEIVVDPTDIIIYVGDDPSELKATVNPADATNREIVWSSSDVNIATVDQNGFVTPVAPGTCQVLARVENATAPGSALSGVCNVTVKEREPEVIPVETLTVSPTELELTEGDDPFQLTATVTPDNATNKTLTWSSSNPAVATVDQEGYVTPLTPGTTVVTVATTDGSNLSATSNVTVLKKEEPGPVIPETPTVPATPIPDGWTGNNNGTYVYPVKIREGNELSLGVNEPTGGYEDAFEYVWTAPDSKVIGDEPEIDTTALLYGEAANAGKAQAISRNQYNVKITNYGPMNEVFWQATYPTATVEVYKRPQIPTQLLRKGDGTSCTFVVMMTPLGNQEILDLGYSYTYGYTDRNGVMHELATTEKRYTHTTSEIYNNPDYTFWAYSRWTYADGSIVTSGLRYLNGGEDPDFDASSIAGTRGEGPDTSGVDTVEDDETVTGIYTLDGRYVGTDRNALERGIYIIRTNNSAKKVAI